MFNQLTPYQAELLMYLTEECAEVIQAVGKVLRHGLESKDPSEPNSSTNKEDLENELGHVLVAKEMLENLGVLRAGRIDLSRRAKHVSVRKYLHHANDNSEVPGWITHVAVVYNGEIYSLPAPNRHSNVLWYICEKLDIPSCSSQDSVQGFIDNRGQFLTRTAAASIALATGQGEGMQTPGILYSEDLW